VACSRATHHFTCIHRCCVLAAAKQCRGEARLERCGLPPLVATSWACAIFPTSVFSHTQKPPSDIMQAAVGSLRDRHLLHLARTAHRSSASAAMALPTASAPPLRLAHVVGGSIERTTRSMSQIGPLDSPMRRPCRLWLAPTPVRATASARLLWQARSRRYGVSPSRSVVALLAHEARLPLWLRQQRQPRSVGSPSVRCRFSWTASSPGVRRCACRPALACGKRLPSRPSASAPAMVAVFGRGCRYRNFSISPRI